MAGSTNKKVVAVRFDREPLSGFVNPQSYLQAAGLELLTIAGTIALLPYAEVKAICFVKDFGGEAWRPNLAFTARPKSEGVWIRARFRDGDSIEGVLPGNLLALEAEGFTLTPPDAGSGPAPRIFVPKAALIEARVLGVIGASTRVKRQKPAREDQLKMFE